MEIYSLQFYWLPAFVLRFCSKVDVLIFCLWTRVSCEWTIFCLPVLFSVSVLEVFLSFYFRNLKGFHCVCRAVLGHLWRIGKCRNWGHQGMLRLPTRNHLVSPIHSLHPRLVKSWARLLVGVGDCNRDQVGSWSKLQWSKWSTAHTSFLPAYREAYKQ